VSLYFTELLSAKVQSSFHAKAPRITGGHSCLGYDETWWGQPRPPCSTSTLHEAISTPDSRHLFLSAISVPQALGSSPKYLTAVNMASCVQPFPHSASSPTDSPKSRDSRCPFALAPCRPDIIAHTNLYRFHFENPYPCPSRAPSNNTSPPSMTSTRTCSRRTSRPSTNSAPMQ
jgi:hypothetical protein